MDDKLVKLEDIQNQIFTVRGVQVMTDNDLADLYGVTVKRLNEQVKRNVNRFPEKFRFQLTEKELQNLRFHFDASNEKDNMGSQFATTKNRDEILRSQFATLENNEKSKRLQNGTIEDKRGKHRKYLPYVFTEQGVSMLSAVLRSQVAVNVSIQIMDAFVETRKFISKNAGVFQRLDKVEQKLIETDTKFDKIFDALESGDLKPKQGVFYNGQIFDAYKLIADIVRSAKKSILLIDNYVDDTVLLLLSKRNNKVDAVIYSKSISPLLKQDLEKHNQQYALITIKHLKTSHDRFIIIDNKTVYHIGASLKDLGKKWFAFSRLDIDAEDIVGRL